MFLFCFQELQGILSLVIVVPPLAPKIKIMIATALTVLCPIKEPGGTLPVMPPTWTVCIITDNTRQGVMVSTVFTGKVITTPPREQRWKSDQWTFKNPLSVLKGMPEAKKKKQTVGRLKLPACYMLLMFCLPRWVYSRKTQRNSLWAVTKKERQKGW